MLGSLDHVTRQLTVHTSPTKRSSDFVAHLEQLDRLYGPRLTRSTHQAGGTRRGQRPNPHKQTLDGGACRPRTLAHRRVVAEVCAGTQRRGGLARSQGTSSGASDLCRLRRARPCDSPGRARAEQSARHPSVGRTTNLCLVPADDLAPEHEFSHVTAANHSRRGYGRCQSAGDGTAAR
jgi:hypothetical protein